MMGGPDAIGAIKDSTVFMNIPATRTFLSRFLLVPIFIGCGSVSSFAFAETGPSAAVSQKASDQIDFDHLADVVKLAHLSELVEALPEGIHTDLGKGKDKLSGGQLQRIGLARALYTRPGLIVMDEATSALDASSENEINRALDEMRGRVTILLIAHRLNTIQRSDIVFLIGEGKLVDSGTFPELLARNAEVQKLVRLMSIQNPQ
jgi:ABC-type multidrug transport system fused ATPase/permease subunit